MDTLLARLVAPLTLALLATVGLRFGAAQRATAPAGAGEVPYPLAFRALDEGWVSREGDAELVPAPVLALLTELEARELETRNPRSEPFPPQATELHRYQLPTAQGGFVEFFTCIAPRHSVHDLRRLLVLYDPATQRTSAAPLVVEGQFLGERGLHPRLADLDHDGRWELVLRHFQHDGTVENIEVAVFYEIGADLELRELLRLPLAERDLHSRGEWGNLDRYAFHATWQGGPALRVEAWAENPRFGEVPDLRGETVFAPVGEDGAWVEVAAQERPPRGRVR